MTYVVVIADKLDDGGLAVLREAPGLEVVLAVKNKKKLMEDLPRADALVVRSETKVTAQLLGTAPKLKVIGRAGIGVDNIDVEAATYRGIAVLNAPAANTISAAEHAVGLLLALERRIPWAHDSMRRGEWERQTFQGFELRGKTLGIVGLGRIGAHVASIARAIGLRLLVHDPFVTPARVQEISAELLPLDDLLAQADIVTLHLPLTAETRHLIDARRLSLMKPNAVLINTARGGLVDEAALVEVITAGKLAGAAVDVFEEEPLASQSPLRTLDRVILTPHLAASTAEAQERVGLEIARSVRDALLRGDLTTAVNVPGVSGALISRLAPLLNLARQVGRLATCISAGRVEGLEVAYGGADEGGSAKAVMLAAVEGALGAMGVGPVSLVNAAVLAEGRGISLGRRVGAPEPGFETTVGVTARTPGGDTSVIGALAGDRSRVIRINNFAVDISPEGYVLVLKNHDVPGVIGRVGTVLGEAQINIGAYHLSRRRQKGDEALAAIVIDHPPPAGVLERLAALPDVIEVRFAPLADGTTV